jgi:Stringent starvation protein B
MMTSTRPYFIRALNDWIVDNLLTPHLMVDATKPGVAVPQQYVKDGKIVLNIAPAAVSNLYLTTNGLISMRVFPVFRIAYAFQFLQLLQFTPLKMAEVCFLKMKLQKKVVRVRHPKMSRQQHLKASRT